MKISIKLNPKTIATAVKIYINYKIVNFDKKYRTVYRNKSNLYILDKLYRLERILNKIFNELY